MTRNELTAYKVKELIRKRTRCDIDMYSFGYNDTIKKVRILSKLTGIYSTFNFEWYSGNNKVDLQNMVDFINESESKHRLGFDGSKEIIYKDYTNELSSKAKEVGIASIAIGHAMHSLSDFKVEEKPHSIISEVKEIKI